MTKIGQLRIWHFPNYMEWYEGNREELMQKFIDKNELTDGFYEYCMNEFESHNADYSDYLYEQERDKKLEDVWK